MKPKNTIVCYIVFCFALVCNAQLKTEKKFVEEVIYTQHIDSVEAILSTRFNVDMLNKAFPLALAMSVSKESDTLRQRGVNLMSIMAKVTSVKIKHKTFDLDSDKVELLISRFENEQYYLEKPKVSKFIKLMDYACKGEYKHINNRLSEVSVYPIALSGFVIYMVVFVLCFFKCFKWKYKKVFKRFNVIVLVLLILGWILFKNTCEVYIEDYSFYGIIM